MADGLMKGLGELSSMGYVTKERLKVILWLSGVRRVSGKNTR